MVTRVAATSQQLCASQCLRHRLPKAGATPPAALHSDGIVTSPRHTWEEQVASPQKPSKGGEGFFFCSRKSQKRSCCSRGQGQNTAPPAQLCCPELPEHSTADGWEETQRSLNNSAPPANLIHTLEIGTQNFTLITNI